MTDPRHKPHISDPFTRRAQSTGGTWGWIVGIAFLALIALILIAGGNSNNTTASNAPTSPAATTGSATTPTSKTPLATTPPASTTGSAPLAHPATPAKPANPSAQ